MHTPPSPLRLTAWNVLAPVYAALDDPRGWYHAVEAWTRWDYRKPRLLARLQASVADVLCLQECAADLLVSEDDALGDGRWRARWVRRGPGGDVLRGDAGVLPRRVHGPGRGVLGARALPRGGVLRALAASVPRAPREHRGVRVPTAVGCVRAGAQVGVEP